MIGYGAGSAKKMSAKSESLSVRIHVLQPVQGRADPGPEEVGAGALPDGGDSACGSWGWEKDSGVSVPGAGAGRCPPPAPCDRPRSRPTVE